MAEEFYRLFAITMLSGMTVNGRQVTLARRAWRLQMHSLHCFDRHIGLQPLAEGAAEIDGNQRPRDGRDGLRYLSSFQIFARLMTPCSDLGRC